MEEINPNIQLITINVNRLSLPVQKQSQFVLKRKKQVLLYSILKRCYEDIK